MIVTLKRDLAGSNGVKRAFHDLDEADAYIQRMCDNLEEDGWELTQDEKSDCKHGLIDCVNKYETYSFMIIWRTLDG